MGGRCCCPHLVALKDMKLKKFNDLLQGHTFGVPRPTWPPWEATVEVPLWEDMERKRTELAKVRGKH